MLHFAYGSNMSRALMRPRCPGALPIGLASLEGYAFMITADGYASVVRRPGATVHGVLWEVGPRDLAALHAYEAVDRGLYRAEMRPVRTAAGMRQALVYIGRSRVPGRPRPGYMDLVLNAARAWQLPEPYVKSLARWSVSRWRGARAVETGEPG